MKIVVLVKPVPDTYGDRVLSIETGLADRAASETVLDEITERALEAAIRHKESASDVEVVAMSMAPADAQSTLRKALAMGADSAVHIADESLAGADLVRTAEVLAAALRRTGFDLALTGNVSTDGTGGVMPAMLAELLDVPAATRLESFEVGADAVQGTRVTDGGTMTVTAALPAVVSITEALPDPRFPALRGIMGAKKKPLDAKAAGDVGIDGSLVGADGSRVDCGEFKAPPAKSAGKIIEDEDTNETVEQIVSWLDERKLLA